MHKNQIKVQTSLAQANTVATEVIASIRTVFSFAMEPMEHARYSKKVNTYYVLNMKQVNSMFRIKIMLAAAAGIVLEHRADTAV